MDGCWSTLRLKVKSSGKALRPIWGCKSQSVAWLLPEAFLLPGYFYFYPKSSLCGE